jgi:hypothetical protein
MKQLHQLEKALSPMGNYKLYRAMIETFDSSNPHIPILSVHLKDLLFSQDGNPTYLNSPPQMDRRLINIPKFESIFQRMARFWNSHQTHYQIKKTTPGLLMSEDYCTTLRALKEQPLYKYSLLCEPKSGDEVLRLREKWMNGS